MAKYLDYTGLSTVWDRIKSYVKARILDLDAEKTSTDGTNVQVKVTEVDGKITAVNITTDNTASQTNLSTAVSNLKGTKASGDTTAETIAGAKVYADNLNTAMDSRVDALEAAIGTGGSVDEKIEDAIDALNKTLTVKDATTNPILTAVIKLDKGVLVDSGSSITLNKTTVSAGTNDLNLSASGVGVVTNAAISEIKDYVDAKSAADVAAKNVSASGETGGSALVTASANNNAVTVGSTTKLLNAVGYAESALLSVSSGNTTYLTVGNKTGNAGAKTLALTVQVSTVSKSGTVSENNLDLTGTSGVVPGSSIATIKGYVDDKITASLGNLLKYIAVNSIGDLPSTQVPAGNIYLVPTYKAVSDPTGNPKTLGWYELSGSTYVLTTDTSVLSGKTYYLKAYDEYILIDGDAQGAYKWEKLGSAGLDLGDYLEKSAVITTSDINTITGISTSFSS